MDASQAAVPSVLPQRDPVVKELLIEIDQALNQFSAGPGATISQLFPRLQEAFWKTAWAIHAARMSGDLPASETDVRDFPAWLRGRIPEPRLQATLHPVFSGWLEEMRGNINHLQRFRKACADVSCSAVDFLLDFGLDIAKSTHALQIVSKAANPPSSFVRDTIVRALWSETLSRPDLSPDTLPSPTTRELTKALNKLQPGLISRSRSVAGSVAGSSRSDSPAPSVPGSTPAPSTPRPISRLLPSRESKKRAAPGINFGASTSAAHPRKRTKLSREIGRGDDGDEDDEADDLEGLLDSSPFVTAPSEGPNPRRSPPALPVGQGFSFGFDAENSPLQQHQHRHQLRHQHQHQHQPRDDTAELVELCRRVMAVGGPQGPVLEDPSLAGAMSIIRAGCSLFVQQAEKKEKEKDDSRRRSQQQEEEEVEQEDIYDVN